MRDNKDDPGHGTPEGKSDADFLLEMRERFQLSKDAYSKLYKQAAEHMRFAFVPGAQWDQWMADTRSGRPKYEVNKTRQALKQITNDQRQNRPQVKVRAAKNTTTDKAELRQGILRGLEAQSRAETAYDTAMQFQVGGGYGVWRVNTQYCDEGAFEQDIVVEEVDNPFSVWFDPTAKKKHDKRDSRFAFVEEDVPRSEYKARWPKADMTDFVGTATETRLGWWSDETIRVVEYWYKEPEQREILQLSDGRVVNAKDVEAVLDEMEAAGITVTNRRTVTVDCVKQCICSGVEVLEGPTEWPGRFIPLVPVYGNHLVIEGKEFFCGETAFAEGAQRMHNYERSTFIEVLAQQPLSPLMAPAASVAGYEKQYEEISTNPPPVLLYNADPSLPNSGKPTREPPPQFPAALAQAAQISGDDIKAVTGKYDASLGARSNETSGKAIMARQQEGDVSSFDYIDNLGKAMLFSAEIISDLLPKIYDTQRTLTLIGEDLQEKLVEVNKPIQDEQTGEWVTVNDLEGRFDFAMTIGPSFTTQRMETAESMREMSNDPSPMGQLAKYGFLKSLDSPGMDEIRKGARKMLVSQGLLEPAEGEQPPQAPPPDPKVMADAQLKQAQAQKVQAETAQITAQIQQGPAPEDKSVEWAKVDVARFDAITKRMALGFEVTDAERQFALDFALAHHGARMDIAQHEAGQMQQDNDRTHQMQMAQFAAANQQGP